MIEDDTNYEAAQARIEAVRAAYKEQVLEEAQSLADSKDYRGAEAVLLNSSDVLGDDPDIAAKLEELQAAELDDYVEGLLKTAQASPTRATTPARSSCSRTRRAKTTA